MKYNTLLEYQDAISVLTERNLAIIDEAKTLVRSLNDDENEEFSRNKEEILTLKAEMSEIQRQLESENTIKNLKKISIDNNMENKDFSLIRSLSEAYKSGQRENITLKRDWQVTGASGEGEDVVSVDLLNEVIMPLREEYLFGQLPCRVMSGLKGNPQIPVYSRGNKAAHVAETGSATKATGAFSNITLAPHRISAYTTISKLFLIQATPAAQEAIVRDLSLQIWDTIEETLLSDDAATEVAPAGLLYNKTAEEIWTYKDLVEMEADLREKKYKDVEFVLSPRAEAWAKSTIKGTNNTSMIMDGGKVDGINTIVTSAVEPNQFLLADFSNVLIGFWGDMTFSFYEDFQLAQDGLVGIVINGFWDGKLARPDALVLAEVTDPNA